MDILAIIQCICSVLSLLVSIIALSKVNSIKKEIRKESNIVNKTISFFGRDNTSTVHSKK